MSEVFSNQLVWWKFFVCLQEEAKEESDDDMGFSLFD
jgi:hypothetical protein